MSERFWRRALQHLPGHAGGSMPSGIESVRGKGGTTVQRVQQFAPGATRDTYTESGTRAALIAQLHAQKMQRK